LRIDFESEAGLRESAAATALAWRDSGLERLTVGLEGELGAGKTTWARAMLRGLGFANRVPSPTFTLLEHYEIGELTVVHLDLYRLNDACELDFLGLRDWLALPRVWLLAEWPERSGAFRRTLDLLLQFGIGPGEARTLTTVARSEAGRAAVGGWTGSDIKNQG
jgi:tRNA threonylcarbamoyladenosine biosynthesis protein TsaE